MKTIKGKKIFYCESVAKYAFIYFIVVFLFAGVYYLCFLFDTTSFLLSKEMNTHVESYFVTDSLSILSLEKKMRSEIPFTIEDLNVKLRPIVDSVKQINENIEILTNGIQVDNHRIDSLILVANLYRDSSIEEYKKSRIAGIQNSIDSLEMTMIGVDSTILILDGRYVELAILKYDYAVELAKTYSLLLEHYGAFIPNDISDSLVVMNGRQIQKEAMLSSSQTILRDLSHEILDYSSSFQKVRRESMSYWTFVYYSIGVSTTFSYGDIAPNSSLTRCLSCIELLICIIIVALFIESLIPKLSHSATQ